jgi:hypothetical protein
MIKAGGEKGSAFARERTITMIFQNILARLITLKGVFADNTDHRLCRPIAVERGFRMGSNK